jgi:hypothetical protein
MLNLFNNISLIFYTRIRKSEEVVDAFRVDPIYLRRQHQANPEAPDYRVSPSQPKMSTLINVM